MGGTDEDLAKAFGVSTVTINAWKQRFPDFLNALKEGKAEADAQVAKSLYRRALGYSHPAVKILQDKGSVIKVPYTEHYPPDTTACIFWLKNRQPDKWRETQRLEHSGPNGGPVRVQDVPLLSDDELARIAAGGKQ